MSLRARLTLLYTSLLGGILLLFGVAVYLIISFLLIAQVDLALQKTFIEFEENSNLKSVVNMELLTLPTLDLTGNVLAQVWDTRGQLILTNYGVENAPAFDPLGLQ
jgi:two-component system OmpR family sensor kinase